MYLTIQGIVLRVTDYNDKDALLTMLTRRHGRLTVKARGLRRKNSPLIAPCQLLAYGEFTLFEYRGQYTINEAQSIELFTPLRRDLTKLSLGTYFAQVSEVLSQEPGAAIPAAQLPVCPFQTQSSGKPGQGRVRAARRLPVRLYPRPHRLPCLRQSGAGTVRPVGGYAGMPELPQPRIERHPNAGSALRAGGHALHLLLRQQEAVFLSGGGRYLAAAFRGDGGVPRHPAGTGLFHAGFLQIATYIGDNHVRIIRKIPGKAGT